MSKRKKGKQKPSSHQAAPAPAPTPAPAPEPAALQEAARAAFACNDWQEVIKLARRCAAPGKLSQPAQRFWARLAAEVHFRQGMDFLSRERYRAVPVELTQATAWMPEDGIYLYHLGLAHHRLEQWENAYAAYERAWKAQPAWRIAYHQALVAIQAGGNLLTDNWEVLYNRLIEIAPATTQGKHAVARLNTWSR